MRSNKGASFRLLQALGRKSFQPCVSVPLVFEYEQILIGKQNELGLPLADIEAVIDYLCLISRKQRVFYLWRPLLKDSKDDMVLELAVAAECSSIITYNIKDFAGAEQFGIQVISPLSFLKTTGELP